MDYDLIYSLIDSLKEEEFYQELLKQKHKVDQNEEITLLIKEINRKQEELDSLKNYGSYVSTTSLEEELLSLKKRLLTHSDVIRYNEALRDANKRLDEVTQLIFKDISEELNIGRMGDLYARYFR